MSLDSITDLPPATAGIGSILVLAESLSRTAYFVTAADTVKRLDNRLILYHEFLEVLISRRDPRLQSELRQALCTRFEIKGDMSSSNLFQSDGHNARLSRC